MERDSYEFTFEVAPTELRSFMHELMMSHSSGFAVRATLRRCRALHAYLALMAGTAALYFTFVGAGPSSTLHMAAGGFLFGLMAFGLVMVWMMSRRLSSRSAPVTADATADPLHAFSLVSCTLRISPAGVESSSRYTRLWLSWEGVAGISECVHGVSIDQLNNYVHVIPTRALKNVDRKVFVETVRRWHREGNIATFTAIGRHLAMNDAACIQCKRSLRDEKGTVCPACGLSLNRFTVPEAFAQSGTT